MSSGFPRRTCASAALIAGLLALASLSSALLSSPSRAQSGVAPKRAVRNNAAGFINGIADTGQFLPDTLILVRVDDRKFDVREYVWSYFNSYAEDRPGQDSLGRVQFMETLINKEVLGRTARAAGYTLRFEDRATLREVRERMLSNVLYRRAILDSAEVTDADIAHTYEQYKVRLHLRHILFGNQATGERVRLELLQGKIGWKDAVKRYTFADKDRSTDGDMGWISRAAVSYGAAEAVFPLQPNELSPIIEESSGFNLIQCMERKPTTPPGLSALRNAIADNIRNYRASILAGKLTDLLIREVHFSTDSVNVNWACKFFGNPQKMEQQMGGTQLVIDENVPEFDAADTSRILARWDGGIMSLGTFRQRYSEIQPFVRPAVNTPNSLAYQVANMALEPYKAELAIKRGLDRDPLVTSQVDMRTEQILVERMYGDSVANQVRVTRAQAQRYYDGHKNGFKTFEVRRFATILRHNQKGADSVMTRLKAGDLATDILRADSLAGLQTGMIHEMRENEHGSYKKMVFEELKKGQLTTIGPDKLGDIAVVQLLEAVPGRQLSFQEAEAMAMDNVTNTMSEARLKAMLKRLRARHKVVEHPELVMRVKLVDPTL